MLLANLYLFAVNINLTEVEVHSNSALHLTNKVTFTESIECNIIILHIPSVTPKFMQDFCFSVVMRYIITGKFSSRSFFYIKRQKSVINFTSFLVRYSSQEAIVLCMACML